MDRRKRFTALFTIGLLLLLTPLVLRYVLPPSTEGTEPSPADFFPVKDPELGRWGFINNQGVAITPMVFDWTSDFREGLGLAESDGQMGYIGADFEKTGEWVISPRFRVLGPGDMPARGFFDGRALARDDSGNWGYIDREGKWAIEPRFGESEDYPGDPAGDFSDGLAWFQTVEMAERYKLKPDGKMQRDAQNKPVMEAYPKRLFGYIDRDGEVVIEAAYPMAQDFGEGLAAVRVKADESWGFIDRAGKRVIAPKYEMVGRFSEGLCAVREDGLWGYIDKKGKWAIRPRFAEVRQFLEGLAPAREGALWGYISPEGNWVIEPAYDDFEEYAHPGEPRPFENGLAQVTLNGRRIYINPEGEKVWPKD